MASSALNHYLLLSSILGIGFAALSDSDSVGFQNTSMTVPENIGQVKICIVFSDFVENDVTGRVFTANPDKDAPFGSVGNMSFNYVLKINNPTVCNITTVLDNDFIEFGKVYYINITSKTNGVPVHENRSTLAIFITDDDKVAIGFSKTSLTVSESDGNATVCMNRVGEARNLGGGQVPQGALSVRLSTVPGTATSNGDFTPLNSAVVDFGLDEMFKCVNVSLNNDNVIEDMETFYVTMTNGSSLVIVNETRNNLTVNIRNDDKVTIGFSKTSLTVSESDGYAAVCMNRVGEARNLGGGELSVRLSTFPGTARGDEDFTRLKSFPVDFGLDETFKCINVTIKDDNITENMETFYVSMANGSSLVIVNEARKSLTVSIRNDDKVTAQFEEAYNKEVEENFEEGEIELGCVIDRPLKIPVQIGFDIDNFTSTAILGSDFTIENKSLTFPNGTTRLSLKIKINRDGEAESPEILVLRMVSLDENLVKIGKNDTAKVKINDKVDNENEAARQKEIENERRSEIYILLIVAIVLIAFLFICGIIFCICFIKSKNN